MAMRSQIDTSMYSRSGGREGTIGDIIEIVNTIRGAAQSRRDREKLQKEEDDLKFVNSTVGKYMQGYAGNDPDDLYQRRQGAYNEILTQRPELQSYVGKSQDADMKGQFEADKNALGLQNDQVTLDNNRQVLKGNQMKNLDDETQWKMKRAIEAKDSLSKVSDQFGYKKVLDDYSDVLSGLTPYYQDYATATDPATAFWRGEAGQVKEKRLEKETRDIEDRDLSVQGAEADIALKKSQTAKNYMDKNKGNGTDVITEATDWKNKLLADPTSRALVQLYATGHMSEQEAMAKVPGFNRSSGPARLALTQAAIELNPPQWDASGNLVGGFNPKGFSISKSSENQSRAGTATVLNKQRMAAQRALSTLDDAYDSTSGSYQNIPDWMYRDLASDYAKILVASGQISEGGVDKIMQKSAKGAVVEIYNRLTGDTKTTAPEKVLALLHDRIRALSTDLDKQYYNQVNGTNLPVNSDESTNPLNPAGGSGDKANDLRKKYGY